MPQMTEMLSAVLSRFGLLQTKQDTPSLAVATQQAYPPPTDTLPVLPPGELLAHRCANNSPGGRTGRVSVGGGYAC